MSTASQLRGSATGQTNSLEGTGYKQVQTFSPEQMELFKQMFGHVGQGSFLSRLAGGDQSQFEQMEKPALKQFQGLQGQLASRFSGMGSGARRSSGFQNAANQQTSDFAQQLMANRLNLQRQAIEDLMGMSSQLLGARPHEQFLQKEEKPWWHSAISGGLPLLGAGVGGFFGGPAGALLGGQLGSAAGSAFF